MKKLIIVITLLAFAGCRQQVITEQSDDTSRFVLVERTDIWNVVYDRSTMVMYAVSRGMYNQGTFTLLVDANGNPLLWEGATE
jgi:hypothetical protein